MERAPPGATGRERGEAMALKVFGSMSEAIEQFGKLEVELSFPLSDSSLASDWRAAGTKQTRGVWAREWYRRRVEMQDQRPITPEDFIAVVAYEADGAKFEEKMGWPALGMWYEAIVDAAFGKKLALNKKELTTVLCALLDTGASVAAFQAMYPDALSGLLRKGSDQPAKPALWAGVNVLLERGWDPNKFSPLRNSEDGGSSMQNLIWESGGVVEHAESMSEIEEHWRHLIGLAMRSGFDLEALSMSGLTTLGGCLRARNPLLGDEADPRVEALIALGADPTRASHFWLANFESNEAVREKMLARLEASQIASASAMQATGTAGIVKKRFSSL